MWVAAGFGCAALYGASRLDFDFFAARVQPIFLKQREGAARCYDCHSLSSNSARFHLEPLGPGGSWSREQSHRNYENAQRLVAPGEPLKSRLLLHPLARGAGGDEFHSGGKFWNSTGDPEWQVLAQWVRGARLKRNKRRSVERGRQTQPEARPEDRSKK